MQISTKNVFLSVFLNFGLFLCLIFLDFSASILIKWGFIGNLMMYTSIKSLIFIANFQVEWAWYFGKMGKKQNLNKKNYSKVVFWVFDKFIYMKEILLNQSNQIEIHHKTFPIIPYLGYFGVMCL